VDQGPDSLFGSPAARIVILTVCAPRKGSQTARSPLLEFTFQGLLFRFTQRAPASAALSQLPPTALTLILKALNEPAGDSPDLLDHLRGHAQAPIGQIAPAMRVPEKVAKHLQLHVHLVQPAYFIARLLSPDGQLCHIMHTVFDLSA